MYFCKRVKSKLLEITNSHSTHNTCLIYLEFTGFELIQIESALKQIKSFWRVIADDRCCLFRKLFDGFIKQIRIKKVDESYTVQLEIFALLKDNVKLNLLDLKQKIKLYFFRKIKIYDNNYYLDVKIKPVNYENYINELSENEIRQNADEENIKIINAIRMQKLISFHGCYRFTKRIKKAKQL